MNLRPLDDRVLVRRVPMPEEKSTIITPDSAKMASTWGQVVAVGPGKRNKHGVRVPLEVKPGDVVIFGQYIDFDRDDFLMIQEQDIRGVVHEA